MQRFFAHHHDRRRTAYGEKHKKKNQGKGCVQDPRPCQSTNHLKMGSSWKINFLRVPRSLSCSQISFSPHGTRSRKPRVFPPPPFPSLYSFSYVLLYISLSLCPSQCYPFDASILQRKQFVAYYGHIARGISSWVEHCGYECGWIYE